MLVQTSDWIGLSAMLVSIAAFVVSFWTMWSGRQARKDDLLVTIHLQLISPDIEEGREAASRLECPEDVAKIYAERGKEKWHRMNRALAMYQFLAQMIVRKKIDPTLAEALWGDRIAVWWPKGALVLNWRRSFTNDPKLYEVLEKWASELHNRLRPDEPAAAEPGHAADVVTTGDTTLGRLAPPCEMPGPAL